MRAMASTALRTISPPSAATCVASSASSTAWREDWAEAFTEAASSSVVAAVSSSAEACSSVRCDRSSAPRLISRAAAADVDGGGLDGRHRFGEPGDGRR